MKQLNNNNLKMQNLDDVLDDIVIENDNVKVLEDKVKQLEEELNKQTSEVKRLKGIILEAEDSQTQLASQYEEQILKLSNRLRVVDEQTKQIQTLQQTNKQLQDQINTLNIQIEGKDKVIETLKCVGKRLTDDQERITKEKISIVEDELEQEKKENERMKKENEEMHKENEEMKMRVNEIDELKRVNNQRNETITKLYEENETLKKTLANFSTDMQNKMMSENNYVDKRVVNKLLISYITKPQQRKEIVDLMSKIMSFTDEEKKTVCYYNQNEVKV